MTSSPRDAEDVTQEVFLTLWRRLPELREDGAVVGWIARARIQLAEMMQPWR